MANTIIQVDIPAALAPTKAILVPAEEGLVEPDGDGYALSSGASPWSFVCTVPEACVGIYRVTVLDTNEDEVAQGWVWIEADDTGTYVADGSFAQIANAKRMTAIATADQQTMPSGDDYVLRTYARGTTTELIPAKKVLRPGGSDLTNPATQQIGGYEEVP